MTPGHRYRFASETLPAHVAADCAPAPREQAPAALPSYWWHVVRGADAMRAFCAAPEHDAWSVVHRYPILLLPEIVDAAEQVLGASHATAGLRQMHRSLRGTPYFVPFHRLLATALGDERGGSPRANLERALAVMIEVRGAIAEVGAPGDELQAELQAVDACEARLREQLAALEGGRPAAPAATADDPAWSSLFLDDNELPGFRRDEPGVALPQAEDCVFTRRGGLASGSAIWLGSDASPVYRVVDTRWLFPSARAATAFVQAILPITGDGLPSVPMGKLGDAAYGWGDARPVRAVGPRDSRQLAIVRVGRMVAKLQLTEGPNAYKQYQGLVHEMVLPYLEAIVQRGSRALSRYWLEVAQGAEAADQLVQTPPRRATQLFSQYPILLLPEFPISMAWLGDTYRAAAESLGTLQAGFKNNWHAYRDVLRALVRTLLDEPAGQPAVNADTALALVVNHRRLDSDYSWAAIEAECRARV